MMENNVFYMQKAYKVALISHLNNYIPVGCVITNKSDEEYITHNVDNKNTNGKHAEILCVDKLSSLIDVKKMSLYTTLIPCPMCSGYIYMKGFDNIYIGATSNNDIYNQNFELLFKKNKKPQILKNKCSCLVSSFFKKMR